MTPATATVSVQKTAGIPQVFIISSVLPRPTSAGEIILHRHLSGLADWDVQVIPHPHEAIPLSNTVKLLKRLERTRFHRWGNDLEVIADGRIWCISSELSSLSNSPAVVLTVAHGDGCWAAQRFARKHRLSLVTIFHDWWPDIPAVHAPIRSLLAARFQQLYRQSDLALCVSGAMQQQLGPHPNSQVLYPIPTERSRSSFSDGDVEEITMSVQQSRPLQMIYAGGLYDYGPMLAELLEVVKDHPTVQVQVRGAKPNWPAAVCEEMRQRHLWLDFAPRAEFEQWLTSADVFLVAMSFDPALQRRMETSFSSKLTEYAQFGKPLVIWGPEYCSAVKWARNGDQALCITEASPHALVNALEKLNKTPDKFKHYAVQAQKVAAQSFHSAILQRQFLEAIDRVVRLKKYVN